MSNSITRGLAIALVGITAAIASSKTLTTRFSASHQHPAIGYGTRQRVDRVQQLHERLTSGDAALTLETNRGYLSSLLDALEVPVESQTLVFSQTSLQASHINPKNPRAIYFTDDVAVAWVRGAPDIELAALDPEQGVMFYTLSQQRRRPPRFQRPNSCIDCHVSDATLGVPGLAVGSTVADTNGIPYSSHAVDHRTMIESRWGGWYVTGYTGFGRHVGNTVATDPDKPMLHHNVDNLNLESIADRFDSTGYLTPYSDIAALMVLEHQTHMTNLLTRVGWEFRVAVHEQRVSSTLVRRPKPLISSSLLRDAVHTLVDYMLFIDEAPLTDRMIGSSGFTSVFSMRGPFDHKGRTLRTIDLDRRLFRYPCSYMIYANAFNALPIDAKNAIYRRLWEVLSGHDPDLKYRRLSSDDRNNIVSILQDTKDDLPPYLINAR